MLFGQGTTDTLFPLQQGLANWHQAITARARRKSIFVGYNGGHTLPAILPQGTDIASDPCSKQLAGGAFADLSLRFFDEQLKREKTGLTGYGSSTSRRPATVPHRRGRPPTKAFPIGR